MKNDPIVMEDYFDPGLKTKPAVHVGSQTIDLFHGKPEEQAWEGFNLAAASDKDVAIVRDFDKEYIKYWNSLMEMSGVINLHNTNRGEFLTKIILNDHDLIRTIQNKMDHNAKLMVFLPTDLEQQLADKLGIQLHGSPAISNKYGTKSGVRLLAKEAGILMPPGFICKTYPEVKSAFEHLSRNFDAIVIKHDLSIGGYLSKKIDVKRMSDLRKELDEVVDGRFSDNKHTLVVEGWLKSKASLCVHIELLENQKPIICGAWQQIIDKDGVTNIGAGPLMLSEKALKSFLNAVYKIANILKQKGAIGSYGPDFLVVADDDSNAKPDTAILIELNARVPRTAFPLEIVKQVKGKVGSGFYAKDIILDKVASTDEIFETLEEAHLLISKRDSSAKGLVPYNIGMLYLKKLAVVSMADSWEEAENIMKKAEELFKNFI